MSSARLLHTIDGMFQMQHGSIRNPVVAYEKWGELNSDKSNAVALFTGLSPSAHAASSAEDASTGWWEGMIGPDRPIDTNRFFVVCVNSLGSCFGSTGPASIDPDTGELYRLDFPVLTIEDIARAGHEVFKSLGISKLYTVIGASMGGMTALAYSILFPEASESLVSISAARCTLPFGIALRSLQREMIRNDILWHKGNYEGKGPIAGMRMARKLGMVSYRSAQEWEKRFGRERVSEERKTDDAFCIDFEVESYMEAHANKFIGTFDANCYLYLSRAMDLFDAADHGGSLEAGLSRVGAKRILIAGVRSDHLFPAHQQRELAVGLDREDRQVSYVNLHSIYGHDSFLVDMDRFRPLISDFFTKEIHPSVVPMVRNLKA
jgi:homoserine O-acetyltransferase